jgi:cell division FtsZ-interacting protein ZapD
LIVYEYPFNERIRTLLRLEDLYEKFKFFVQQEHPMQHHVALSTIFDMLEVAGRADLKSDLLQELERQRQSLLGYRMNPNVQAETLDAILDELDKVSGALVAAQGKTGQNVRDNEWLMSIRGRTIIPGGACEFDLPSYYAWQKRPAEQRFNDIITWFAPLAPLFDALAGAALAARLGRPGEDDRRHRQLSADVAGEGVSDAALDAGRGDGRDSGDFGQQVHAVGTLYHPGRRPETQAAGR